MIKRILFFLALFFIAFAIYYFINRDSAQNFIFSLRDAESQINSVVDEVKEGTGSVLEETPVEEEPENTAEQVTESVKDTVLVVSDEIKDVVSKELGLDNREGTVIVMQNPTINVSGEENTVTETTSSNDKVSTTATPGKLSQADLDMLARLAQNIE